MEVFYFAQKATEGLITGGIVSTPISKIKNDMRAKDTLSINQWVPSAYEIYNKNQKISQAAPVVQTLGTITPTNRIPLPDLRINNNINDYFLKNNPPKWVNPQTATLGQTINNNIQNNIPSFDFNTAVTTRGNNQQTPKYDKIFTPEDIGKMTPEEFSKNEKTINEQCSSISI